jgi:hypothetical protein
MRSLTSLLCAHLVVADVIRFSIYRLVLKPDRGVGQETFRFSHLPNAYCF